MSGPDLSYFKEITTSEWREKILSELKGQSWETLQWKISDKIILEPGYHKDDAVPVRFLPGVRQGKWLIGESFADDQPGELNRQLLEALSFGLESPQINILEPDRKKTEEILQGVYPDFIDLNWAVSDAEAAIRMAEISTTLYNSREENKTGAFIFPISIKEGISENMQKLKQVLASIENGMFRCIHICPVDDAGKPEELPGHMGQYLAAFAAAYELVSTDLSDFQLTVYCGDQILLEIAKFRALRLCMANILASHGVEKKQPVFINARMDESYYTDDPNYNRIKGALTGWAMANGGADRMEIVPGGRSMGSFDRRIARNVQHLLKMESFMDLVADPVSGSYYIESLTNALAEAAWEEFCRIDAFGDYHNGKPLSR